MSSKIIITEKQYRAIKTHILESGFLHQIVEKMKADLDRNYEPMVGVMREGGEYFEKPMIKIKADGEAITPKALFEYLSYKYKFNPEFIKQLITDWMFGRIQDNKLSKNVSLS
jgi:hypothetical protein